MAKLCTCGNAIRSFAEDWGCLECGTQCCPECAYHPEAAIFCSICTKRLFENSLPDYALPSLNSKGIETKVLGEGVTFQVRRGGS